jgi:hypothetical protein
VATVMLEPLQRRGYLGQQEENRPNITKSLTSDSSKIFTFWTEIMSAKSPTHSSMWRFRIGDRDYFPQADV